MLALIGRTLSTRCVIAGANAHDRHGEPEVLVLAAGAALAFAGIDFWYVLVGTIPPIYLADALVELALLFGLKWTHSAV